MAKLLVQDDHLTVRLNPYEMVMTGWFKSPRVPIAEVDRVFWVHRAWSEVLEPARASSRSRPLDRGIWHAMARTKVGRSCVVSLRARVVGKPSIVAVYGDRPAVILDLRSACRWGTIAVTAGRASATCQAIWKEVAVNRKK